MADATFVNSSDAGSTNTGAVDEPFNTFKSFKLAVKNSIAGVTTTSLVVISKTWYIRLVRPFGRTRRF